MSKKNIDWKDLDYGQKAFASALRQTEDIVLDNKKEEVEIEKEKFDKIMRFFIRQEEEYIDAECYDLMYKDFKGLGCTFNEITKGKTTYVVLKLVNRIIRRLAGY